jgi:hypothetical protein
MYLAAIASEKEYQEKMEAEKMRKRVVMSNIAADAELEDVATACRGMPGL